MNRRQNRGHGGHVRNILFGEHDTTCPLQYSSLFLLLHVLPLLWRIKDLQYIIIELIVRECFQ